MWRLRKVTLNADLSKLMPALSNAVKYIKKCPPNGLAERGVVILPPAHRDVSEQMRIVSAARASEHIKHNVLIVCDDRDELDPFIYDEIRRAHSGRVHEVTEKAFKYPLETGELPVFPYGSAEAFKQLALTGEVCEKIKIKPKGE